MFHQNDLRMAKAQQERLLAQAAKRDGRAQRANGIVALVQRLVARREKKAAVEVSPAEANA